MSSIFSQFTDDKERDPVQEVEQVAEVEDIGKQSTDTSVFSQFKEEPQEPQELQEPTEPQEISESTERQENAIQTFNRYLGQIPAAAISIATWPLSVITTMAQYEAREEFDEIRARLPRLKKLFPNVEWEKFEELDEQKYEEAIQLSEDTFPSTSRIIRSLEETTGLPLEAKTKGQRALRFITEVATLSPGSAIHKVQTALKANAYSAVMQAGGADESVSDLVGLGLSQFNLPTLTKKEAQQGLKDIKIEKDVPPGEPPPRGPGEPPPIGPTDKALLGEEFLTERPLFPSLVSEDEILTRIEPLLQEELERKISKIPPPKLKSITKEIEAPSPTHVPTVLERKIGNQVSKVKFPNRQVASQSIRREIKDISTKEYEKVQDLYKTAKERNAFISEIRPEMINELEDLVYEMSLAEVPSMVEKDIRTIANKYIQLGGDLRGIKEISQDKLISQIESNNKKVQHDYLQGTPSNSYRKLNKIFDNAIQLTAETNKGAVDSYNIARTAYRDWAEIFKSNEIIPWRDPGKVNLIKLLKNIENPDQILILEDVLGRTKKGRNLLGGVKRDYVETQMRPFINDPKKVDSIEFNDKIKEVSTVLPAKVRHEIEKDFIDASDRIIEHDRLMATSKANKSAHAGDIQENSRRISDWNKEVKKEKSDFPYKTDKSILNEMKTVRGQKRLENNLPKTARGKAMMDEIKDYSAVNLLTQGKINPSDKAESLRAILNDVNKRALLEHTLGKSITNDLRDIVNNVPRISKKISSMKESSKMLKTAGKLIPGLRGNIATAEAFYDIWRMFTPAVESANYGMIDMKHIQKIIENRKFLLAKGEY